jgi:histidinol-phosphatase (PHP family)
MTLKMNLHTHTWRCRHATGDVADYCRAAQAQGLTLLGMSDHVALPDDRWLNVRMSYDQLGDYCRAVDTAREAFPELVVLKAMECEHVPAFERYYREVLLGDLGFDYLIGGAHNMPWDGGWKSVYGGTADAASLRAYTDYVIASMATGLFAFIAHPDLFANAYLVWDAEAEACSRAILAAAAALAVPLEINGYGMRKSEIRTPEGVRRQYPWRRFWELAEAYGVRVVVTSDAHRPVDVGANLAEGMALAADCGLEVVGEAWVEERLGSGRSDD